MAMLRSLPVGHAGKQNLVLVATAQNLFHPPHTPAAVLCAFIWL
jgi:hypothetical protein